MNAFVVAVVLAAIAAVLIAVAAKLRIGSRLRAFGRSAWDRSHRRQWAEIQQLRRDLDGCLRILDHLSQPGSGDWSAQWTYARKVLGDLGKDGICWRDDGS